MNEARAQITIPECRWEYVFNSRPFRFIMEISPCPNNCVRLLLFVMLLVMLRCQYGGNAIGYNGANGNAAGSNAYGNTGSTDAGNAFGTYMVTFYSNYPGNAATCSAFG